MPSTIQGVSLTFEYLREHPTRIRKYFGMFIKHQVSLFHAKTIMIFEVDWLLCGNSRISALSSVDFRDKYS